MNLTRGTFDGRRRSGRGNIPLSTIRVPKGRFPGAVLKGMGYANEEVDPAKARFAGEGEREKRSLNEGSSSILGQFWPKFDHTGARNWFQGSSFNIGFVS